MAFNQVTPTSLTPTRPAPSAPGRNGPTGYGSSFSAGTSSPSGSYTGIGGSPNRASESITSAQVVRAGIVSVKEDGLVSWLWRPKWLVLKEDILLIHKNEVRTLPLPVSAHTIPPYSPCLCCYTVPDAMFLLRIETCQHPIRVHL